MVKIECVVEAGNYLGEGPVWDPVEGVLYWVDMLDKEVWRLDPRTGKTRTLDPAEDRGRLCAPRAGRRRADHARRVLFHGPR